ncbi:hypothetical protein Tco_1360163 [Tanacetum coccineum]
MYDALMQSLIVDEDDMDKHLEEQSTPKKRRQDDNDQDPSADLQKEKKKIKQKDYESSKKNKDQASSSKKEFVEEDVVDVADPSQADASVPKRDNSTWFKQPIVERPETPDPKWSKEPNDAPEQPWLNEMVNAEKDPLASEDAMGLVIDFIKFIKNYLKKDKLTKVDLEGLAFNLLKGKHRNYIELEYKFKQCYVALTDQHDWVNPEGDKIPHDFNKPLPLHDAPTIPVDFFFSKDLYSSKVAYDKDDAFEISHWGPKCKLFYRLLEGDCCKTCQSKGVHIREADFPSLHLNDIEDMYLLYAQNKLHHLKGDEQTNLVNALWFFIRRIMIQKRVEDVQLGVESYQTKLNLKNATS